VLPALFRVQEAKIVRSAMFFLLLILMVAAPAGCRSQVDRMGWHLEFGASVAQPDEISAGKVSP
jgi:hypothetical protein